jgi:hypothetical protein
MTELTRPKPNRFKYAAMLLGAAAIAAAPLASPAITTAQPNSGTWDLEAWDDCWRYYWATNPDHKVTEENEKQCCWQSGGLWQDGPFGHDGKCVAPPAEPASGSRQLPGNVQIPSDIATAPVTKAPPRPIQVPSDIATVSAASQAPA